MKKTIHGLRYDTENSQQVGRYNNGLEQSDLQFWEATLYVYPRSNRYFLAGKGGPMTLFGPLKVKPIGWTGELGERLVPISKENAYEWAKTYLSIGEVDEYFGDIAE